MSRVLVTGAGGFVGSHVITPLIRAGFEVIATSRKFCDRSDVRFKPADLLDQTSRRELILRVRPSHLLHLAWIADPGIYWRSPANLQWAAATLDLVRTFHEVGGTRCVAVGSCAEYMWGGPRFNEDETLCLPATLYGAAKDSTRRLLDMFALEHSLSFAWARLFFLYGPGEKPGRLVSDAIEALQTGVAFPTSAGTQRRDFLHIADAAAALSALLASEVTGAVNIASGTAFPIRDILEHLASMIGNRHLIRFGERPLSPNEPTIIEGDVMKLSRDVGFKPQYDIYAGLRDTVSRAVSG